MTSFNLRQIVGATALLTSLSILPLALPTLAQTNNNSTINATSSQNNGYVKQDHGSNWGWLGVIGLIGLGGLVRPRQEAVDSTEPEETNYTSNTEAVRYQEPNETNQIGNTPEAARYQNFNETDHVGNTSEPVHYNDPDEKNRPGNTGSKKGY